MATLPQDSSVEAEYEDGFVLSETETNDTSQYSEGHNTFRDILEKRPEADHGRMVRFSVFWKDARYDLDWTDVPDNARPIRFRDGNRAIDTATGEERFWWSAVRFGYQYNDVSGKNHKIIEELT